MKFCVIHKNRLVVLMLMLGFLVLVRCHSGDSPKVLSSKHYAGLTDSASYVGILTCKECHLSIYNSFVETGMGKSFDRASRNKSAAHYGKHAPVYDPEKDFYYHPFWSQDSLYVLEFRLEGKDTIYKRVVQVSAIVGSGQHTNSHIMYTNGYLNQVPVTFYTQRAQWDLAPGFENGNNTRFSRKIGIECMSCHNSFPEFVLGSENKYREVFNGIGCERCHGPGSVHVQQKRSSQLVDVSKEIDFSIVNPAKLPVNLQFDVCQRCHIQGNAVLNPGKSFFDFKPGMSLASVMNVFMPIYEGRENEHIMASHAERLKKSKCYLESIRRCDKEADKEGAASLYPYKNALTCVTCHNPHVSVRVTGNDHFNTACKNCHSPGKDHLCNEKEQLRIAKDDNCIACHMPKSGATDIPHVTVTDHHIQIIEKKKLKQEIKKFTGITCINNMSPTSESIGKAYIAYFEKFNMGKSLLDSAAVYLSDETNEQARMNFHSLVQLYFLKLEYSKIVDLIKRVGNPLAFLLDISYSNDDAWCCYRIGEAFSGLQDQVEALKYYKRATELAPYIMDFQNKYGACLIQNNDLEAAKRVFELIIKEDSGYFQAYSNLGFLYLTRYQDTARAAKLYDQSIALNPDYEQALLNKVGLYLYRQRKAEASKILHTILKRNPRNEKARQILARLTQN